MLWQFSGLCGSHSCGSSATNCWFDLLWLPLGVLPACFRLAAAFCLLPSDRLPPSPVGGHISVCVCGKLYLYIKFSQRQLWKLWQQPKASQKQKQRQKQRCANCCATAVDFVSRLRPAYATKIPKSSLIIEIL